MQVPVSSVSFVLVMIERGSDCRFAVLLVFSFAVLLGVYRLRPQGSLVGAPVDGAPRA